MVDKNIFKILFFWGVLGVGLFHVLAFSSINVEGQITEIAPITIQEESEWLEFRLQTKEIVDLQHWKIQKNESKAVPFSRFSSDLKRGVGTESVNHEDVLSSGTGFVLSGSGYSGTGSFTSVSPNALLFRSNRADGVMYFFIEDMPFSLTDGGARIRILNEKDEVIASQRYEKTKYFTKNGQKYGAEIWNLDEQTGGLVPLIYKKDLGNFHHTKGTPNAALPTRNEDVSIVFSEIAPNQEAQTGRDFLEIYVASGPEKINLKYATIKHNGTTLYAFENDFWVQPEEFIILEVDHSSTGVIQKKSSPYLIHSAKTKGLSAGSGTYELILFTGTSWEQTADFVCYQKEKLSQSEQARVDRNQAHWKGACVEIEDLIKNESVARVLNNADTDTNTDFFRHFNGSKGMQNQLQNSSPSPVITVQGSGKTTGVPPFSLNLTAEETTDPDGPQDLKTFEWTLNGVVFSTEANPQGFKLEQIGTHHITLMVTDFSGASATTSLEVVLTSSSSGEKTLHKKALKTFLKKSIYKPIKKQKSFQRKTEVSATRFFDSFLSVVDESFLQAIALPEMVQTTEPVMSSRMSEKKKNQQNRDLNPLVRKNLGLIFEP